MGLVVRARDEVLQRIVALKFISPGREFSRESLDKLLQEEARLVAQLDHENIVRIFDVSEWKGSPFLIMECLTGQSLAALLRQGPLEPSRALRILSDIAAGLAHAHSRNIIHRDLKPSNVFILPDGQVKLLDFGLARFASSLNLPQEGTPAFMAPEQWRGQPQDMRTDIWAAGLLLYQMLTGTLPYDPGDLRERVLSAEPVTPVRTIRPDLPEPLDRFLARALAKAPARRFQSALEMRERLRMLEWSLAPSADASPPRFTPHRRQVTLVCCRLSAHLESFDAEDVSELQAAFQQACSRMLERHGGWVALRMGDEVMGCFGYPLAREDDVLCAVRAALALTGVAAELPGAEQAELAVQVGVHTDMVVLDVFDPSGLKGRSPSIQGEAPRVALWLARQAAPGTANLSENTCLGARGNFVTEPLGPRDFSSAVGTVRMDVHRVLSERPETTRFGRARTRGLTPLVARSDEMRQLVARWEGSRKGQGTVVLLSGEAGIGKSRLIQELCEYVVREGERCVSSQCWPQFSRSAFHPVLEWVVHLLGLEPAVPPASRWARLEEVLKTLDLPLPEGLLLLGQFLALPPREDLPPLLLSVEQQRERTLHTLATFLLRLSARLPGRNGPGGLLLILEDLHWADPSTLQLLTLLQERIELGGMCLLLSTRPGLRLSWRRHPGFHRLALDRLAQEDTAEMVRRLTQNQSSLPEETLEFLVRQTEGNPLFIEEMTRMVLSRTAPGGEARLVGPLPVTLQELLLARLDLLSEEQKELAWKGAVLGRSFTLGHLAALCPERDVTSLRGDLAELVEEGLLLSKGDDAEPHYEFKHALIQEAAYESQLKLRRRLYHHQVANLLEHPASGTVTAPPELIAHHYTRAGELEPAIRFWAQAGELALWRSAFEESVAHLEEALGLFKRLPRAARRIEEELQLLVLLGQALIATRGYSAPEVDRLYARISESLQEVRDIPILVAACRSLFFQNMMRLSFPSALKLSAQIVSQGQRVHVPQLLVVGRLMGGMNHFMQGHVAEAQEMLGEAVAQGDTEEELDPRSLGLLEVEPLAMAMAFGAVSCIIRCEQQQGLQLMNRAIRRAERLGHPHTSLLTYEMAAMLHWIRFDAHLMLEAANKALAIFDQGLFPTWEGWAPALRGWALLELGRRQEGYDLLLRDLERQKQAGAEIGQTFFSCLLAHARLRMGLISEGLTAATEGLAWGTRTGDHLEDPELHRLRGELLMRDGEAAKAQSEFQEAIRIAHQSGARCIEVRATLSLCHLLLEQGRSREARRRLWEVLGSFPPGLHSTELRIARALLARFAEDPSEEPEVDQILSTAPWEPVTSGGSLLRHS
ncbi:hypothetical protein BON30_22450 [Cystobacter ferrugineus]|uniref:Protein kinase domain-containing protein n=2 Tax=Cystobacter ferrugineus TaxID=83449 RepID=A0A1L9B9P6_9BACT|nr:hypothetical protein BON30_22450 [Cystobacter ferrugineus]